MLKGYRIIFILGENQGENNSYLKYSACTMYIFRIQLFYIMYMLFIHKTYGGHI